MTLEEEIEKLNRRWNELYDKFPKASADLIEKEQIREARMQALQQQAKPLTDELLETGIRIESVWDLVNTTEQYPEAIPVLIKHLNLPYNRAIKDGIVRALAVKEAKGLANKAILAEYHKAPREDHHFRWAFGNTMRVIVTNDDLDELIQIVLDESNGDSRDMFIRALAKLKSSRVRETLEQLVNDKSEIISKEARNALERKRPAN